MPPALPSTKEALVLSLLASHGDLYGLQLVSLAKGKLKKGTVYVTLARMEDKGLVRTLRDHQPEGHAGMPRPRYRLTAAGERALRACDLVRSVLEPSRVKA